MKNKIMLQLLAGLLCLCAFSGCGKSSLDAAVLGTYLGTDIDKCYEDWGITKEDEKFREESLSTVIALKEPISYLGGEFTVVLSYPNVGELYTRKLDSVRYYREMGTDAESVAREAAGFLAAIEKDYGDPENVWTERITYQKNGDVVARSSSPSENPALTEDFIRKSMEETTSNREGFSLICEWFSDEEFAKLDQTFVEAVEASNGWKSTYQIHVTLSNEDGEFTFLVRHSFGRRERNGLN